MPNSDIVEPGDALAIQQGIEPAERRQAAREARVVQERDDAGESRRGRGRAADEDGLAREEDAEEVALRGDVRDALREWGSGSKARGGSVKGAYATGAVGGFLVSLERGMDGWEDSRVEETLVGALGERRKVARHGLLLERGARELHG